MEKIYTYHHRPAISTIFVDTTLTIIYTSTSYPTEFFLILPYLVLSSLLNINNPFILLHQNNHQDIQIEKMGTRDAALITFPLLIASVAQELHRVYSLNAEYFLKWAYLTILNEQSVVFTNYALNSIVFIKVLRTKFNSATTEYSIPSPNFSSGISYSMTRTYINGIIRTHT